MRLLFVSFSFLFAVVSASAHPYEPVFEALESAIVAEDMAVIEADKPNPVAIAELAERVQPVRVALHEAAANDEIIWVGDYSAGPETLLPHLSKSRSVLRVIGGTLTQSRTPVEDVIALRRMAAHLKTEPTLVSRLVGIGTEAATYRYAASILAKLSDDQRQALRQALGDLPVTPSPADTLRAEGRIFSKYALTLAPAGNPVAQQISDEILQVTSDAGGAMELPKQERDARLEEIEASAQELNPATQKVVPSYGRYARTVDRIIIDRELFHLALDGLIAGDVEAHVGDAASYEPLPDGGFRLSKRVDDEYIAEIVVDGVR
ncbi:MAG: hypothetical protein AAGD32_11045 [Planctomycetota bacterium]